METTIGHTEDHMETQEDLPMVTTSEDHLAKIEDHMKKEGHMMEEDLLKREDHLRKEGLLRREGPLRKEGLLRREDHLVRIEDLSMRTEGPLKRTEDLSMMKGEEIHFLLIPLDQEAMEDSLMRTDLRMMISFQEIDQDSVDLTTLEKEEVKEEEVLEGILEKGMNRDHPSDLSEMKMVQLQMSKEDHLLRETWK
jgi:hypothetical protein